MIPKNFEPGSAEELATARETLRSCVRGHLPWEAVQDLAGIRVTPIAGGYTIENPRNVVATVGVRDVAEGLLRYRGDPIALKSWAFMIMGGSSLLDLEDDFEETPDGEALLDALWKASFLEEVDERSFSTAARLMEQP
jgi:hypothetical protein